MDETDSATQTLDDVSVSVWSLLSAMDHHRNRVSTKVNLSGSELRALALIAEADSITPKLLAESMDMTTGAVTAISNRLVAMELLTREAHPHDRRSLLLVLTPAAVQMTESIYYDFRALIAHAVRDVNPEDQARLGALLTSMAHTIGSDAEPASVAPAL